MVLEVFGYSSVLLPVLVLDVLDLPEYVLHRGGQVHQEGRSMVTHVIAMQHCWLPIWHLPTLEPGGAN